MASVGHVDRIDTTDKNTYVACVADWLTFDVASVDLRVNLAVEERVDAENVLSPN